MLDLPRVHLLDIGAISVSKNIKPLLTDFLLILHGLVPRAKKFPVVNVANLAIVADRFDCASALSRWANSKGHLATVMSVGSEETVRQRILTGILLGHAKWVNIYSKELIIMGSMRWGAEVPTPNAAMWWDLPRRVEGKCTWGHLLTPNLC